MSERPSYGTAVDRRWRLLAAVALTILVSDQATKMLAVKHLTPGIADAVLQDRRVISRTEQAAVLDDTSWSKEIALFYGTVRNPCRFNGRLCPEVKVFESFWSWRYAENKGAAWSMFAQLGDSLRLPLLIGVSALAVLFILSFVRKLEPDQDLLLLALALVLGGALGNLVDRAYLGYVVDFIVWHYDGRAWPTFNIADVGISVGVGLILLSSVLDMIKGRGQASAQTGVAQP